MRSHQDGREGNATRELRQLVHDAWSTHHQRHGHRRCSSAADGDLRSTVSLSLSLARRRISSSVAAVGALPTSFFDLGSKDSVVEREHISMYGRTLRVTPRELQQRGYQLKTRNELLVLIQH